MKKLLSVLCLVVSFLIGSCNKNDTNKKELSREINLELIDSIRIELDSLTGFFSPNLQVGKLSDGNESLAILNTLISRIQVYNLQTGKNEYNINIDLVGPNGVGEQPSAFFIQNRDSVFIYDSWSTRVSLINSKGIILDKYNLSLNGLNDGFAIPQASTQKPMLVIDNVLYMAGLLLPWEGLNINENQFLRFDLGSKELSYFIQRPDIYNKHNWGNRVMFGLNHSYDPANKELILSFNNYDSLIVADLDGGNERRFYTPSTHFDEIVPYDDEFSYEWNSSKQKEYNFQNPRYWDVIHDPFNDLTFRFALRPNSREKFKSGVRNMQVSLIILNSKFERVGEFDFDRETYDSRMSFVTEKGIYFANKTKFGESEDYLVFDIFNIKK